MVRPVLSGLLLVAACRGSNAPAEPAPPAGPTCASVMPRMTDAAVASLERGNTDPEFLAEARREAEAFEPRLVQACLDDRWSPELLACIERTPPAEFEQCEPLVTEAQKATVIRLREEQMDEP